MQIDMLMACDRPDLLERHRVNGDESLLQLAAIFHGDVQVMSRLASACPRLLLIQVTERLFFLLLYCSICPSGHLLLTLSLPKSQLCDS
jgi:hypothetical protein